MKKKIFLVLSLVLIMALMAMPVNAAKPAEGPARVVDTVSSSVIPADHPAAELMAGQVMPVGYVYINACAEPNTYEVRYEVTEPGWFLTEIHFEAINEGDDVFIENNGTLIPGKFTAKAIFNLASEVTEYSFRYASEAVVTEFAAHAVVEHPEVGHIELRDFCIVSGVDTSVGDGNAVVTAANAWAGINVIINAQLPCEDVASYIWDAALVTSDCADNGGMVDFMHSFNIVGTPKTAELMIAADNAFAYHFNDGDETAENLVENWRDLVALGNFDPGVGEAGDTLDPTVIITGLQTNGWGVIYTYDVFAQLQSGDNTFYASALNADWNTTNPLSNPAMLIYKLCGTSELYVKDENYQKESAWGAGVDAGTRNWSMVIPVGDAGMYFVESVEVLAHSPEVKIPVTAYSEFVLEEGATYKLVVSGTAFAGDTIEFDAEYSITTRFPGDTWTESVTGYTQEGEDLLDLFLNGEAVEWGNYNPTHVYEFILAGNGSIAEFFINDIYCTNNTGSLIVDIYKMP